MDCSTCKYKYDNDIIAGMAERTIRRLVVIVILLIVLLTVTNGFWVWRETQYATEEIEVIQRSEDGGNNNYVGNDGDIYNGYDDSYEDNEE